MGLSGVESSAESGRAWAARLAKDLKVPLLSGNPNGSGTEAGSGVKLVVSEIGLGLAFTDPTLGKKPYYVDFTTRAWKQRFHAGLPKNHIFRKALGLRQGSTRVLDATAGFGQDTMMILSLNAALTALERSTAVFAVLQDGLERAGREEESLKERLAGLRLINEDVEAYLARVTPAQAPDVIYLDPMFDKPKKSAKSPKEMQLLHALLGEPPSAVDEQQLLQSAMRAARQRVVVKRPLKARAVLPGVAHSFKGQSVRYDVYLRRSKDLSVS